MTKLSLSAAFSDKKVVNRLKVGTYHSEVVSVAYSTEHVNNSALEIHYRLTASNGDLYEFKEYFFLKPLNARSRSFLIYLKNHDIDLDDLETFIGCQETLVLKRSTTSKFLTIESRTFLSRGDS